MTSLPAVVGELVARWRKQAAVCLADASRLDGSVARELERDAAQYEQCAGQVERALSALTAEAGKGESVVVDDAMVEQALDAWRGAGIAYAVASPTRMRAAITAALSTATPAGEWREIESAPRDGTRIAIKFQSGNEHEANWQTTYGGEWHVDSFKFLPWADQHEITHWRPLPSPPSPGAAK